jgi:DNA replication protein DnaC
MSDASAFATPLKNLDDHLERAAKLKLGLEGFLTRLAEAEVLARKETALRKRLQEAEFPEICRLEDYDFKRQPSLSRDKVLALAELGFIDRSR